MAGRSKWSRRTRQVRNRRTAMPNYSRPVTRRMWARARTPVKVTHTLVAKPKRRQIENGGIMEVAIVHDWLVAPGGAEKVLEQIIKCFPDADLFSLVDF